MNKLLILFSFLTAIAISVLFFPDGAVATLVCLVGAGVTVIIINRLTDDDEETKLFLRQIFVGGLLFRVIIAAATYAFALQIFFCEDAVAFDETGAYIVAKWSGQDFFSNYDVAVFSDTTRSGWGISYLTAIFYWFLGRNPLAVQMFISVLGAATAVLVYVCAKQIFNNERVARLSAVFVMIFPSIALWSSQILKDGVIIFLLVGAICIVLRLQQSFSYIYLALLFGCLAGISAFRFYILLALVPAIIGGFIIDPQKSFRSLILRSSAVLIFAVSLSYLGFLGSIENQLGSNVYSLESLNRNRQYLSEAAESGFGKDLDVSTVEGLSAALPIGFTYLIFAPFPWDISSFRQAVTLPEVLVWWTLIPLLVFGLWYTLKHRLRHAVSILLFSLILTITYSISQGNVGTAYRQRAQIQVFYFMFISVGVVIMLEKRENSELLRKIRLRNPGSLRHS